MMKQEQKDHLGGAPAGAEEEAVLAPEDTPEDALRFGSVPLRATRDIQRGEHIRLPYIFKELRWPQEQKSEAWLSTLQKFMTENAARPCSGGGQKIRVADHGELGHGLEAAELIRKV